MKYIAKKSHSNMAEFFRIGDIVTLHAEFPDNDCTKPPQSYYGMNTITGQQFRITTNFSDFVNTYLDPYIEEDVNSEIILEDPIDDFDNNELPFKTVIDEMYRVYLQKNSDYGNSFDKSLDKFGLISSVVRLNDKFNRIESLIKNNKQMVKDESIRDTFLDLANYAAMTVAWLDNK